MPTAEARARWPRSASRPSLTSIIAVAPARASAGPRSYGGAGWRCASTSGPSRTPADSSANPAAARPTVPARTTRSPRPAPARVTGGRPCRSPSAVTARVSASAATTSPPTTLAPTSAHSSRSPSATPSATASGVDGGQPRPTRSAVGTAPIAATSAKFWAAALRPTSYGVDHSSRKCRRSTSRSVVATTVPDGAGTTAASSPGPAGGGGAPSRRAMRATSPNSPADETVTSPLCCYRRLPGVTSPSHERGSIVVQAYILIQTEVCKAASVARAIAGIEGVTQAEDVTGPYDVIVRAEARNVDELGKLVVARVQAVDGITRTLTCPVVHL